MKTNEIAKSEVFTLEKISESITLLFGKSVEEIGTRGNTIKAYKSDMKRYIESFKDSALSPFPLDQDKIIHFVSTPNSLGVLNKKTTVQRTLNTVNRYNVAIGDKDFSEFIKRVVREVNDHHLKNDNGKKKAKDFSDEEFMSVLKSLDESVENSSIRDKAIIMLAYVCGLRGSDISNIKMSDIERITNPDFDGYVIHVGGLQKNREENTFRAIPRGGYYHAAEALEEWMEFRDEVLSNSSRYSDKLFIGLNRYGNHCNSDGITYVNVLRIFKKVFGEEYSPHSARVSVVTNMVRSGCSYDSIKRITGHKNSIMIDYYTAAQKATKNKEAMNFFGIKK